MKHLPTCTTRRPRLRSSVPAIALALLLGTGLVACGEDSADSAESGGSAEAADSLVVTDPWVRATIGSEDATMTAAFMTLDNDGDEAVTLTGASAEFAGRAELHEMAAVDGEMGMRKIDELILEPGRGQLLQPGGHHVMLMELDGELAAGDEVELVLELSDGSEVTVTAPVKEFTEEAGHYHDHDSHDHGDDDHADEGGTKDGSKHGTKGGAGDEQP